MLELKGIVGKSISIEGNSVLINEGKFLLGRAKEHSIPIRSIIAVYVKKPGMQAGLIQFQTAGRMDNSFYRDDVTESIKDRNAVLFHGKGNYEIALKIKSYIENYSDSNENNIDKVSIADEIAKLKKLLDDNIISEEEFDKAKRKVLNG